MQLTAPCTLISKVHRVVYLHVCIIVKTILHEIHTQRVLFSLGKVDFFGCVSIEMHLLSEHLIVHIRENGRLTHKSCIWKDYKVRSLGLFESAE